MSPPSRTWLYKPTFYPIAATTSLACTMHGSLQTALASQPATVLTAPSGSSCAWTVFPHSCGRHLTESTRDRYKEQGHLMLSFLSAVFEPHGSLMLNDCIFNLCMCSMYACLCVHNVCGGFWCLSLGDFPLLLETRPLVGLELSMQARLAEE